MCHVLFFIGYPFVLASGKINFAGGKIVREIVWEKIPDRACEARKFLNNGMWGVFSPGLVTSLGAAGRRPAWA